MGQRNLYLIILTVQVVCAGFFLWNILSSIIGLRPIAWQFSEFIELGAAFGLLIGVALGGRLLQITAADNRKMHQQLKAASGAFHELIEDYFTAWQLTPAERDVALFAIKGVSTPDIAKLRGVSEGTVKAQTNAIYRKAGVNGRPQLLSLFIDDLIELPLR